MCRVERRAPDNLMSRVNLSGRQAAQSRRQTPALLRGLIFGPTGAAMSPSHTRKGGRLYRYNVSQTSR
jgi:hypothetical protein